MGKDESGEIQLFLHDSSMLKQYTGLIYGSLARLLGNSFAEITFWFCGGLLFYASIFFLIHCMCFLQLLTKYPSTLGMAESTVTR